MPLVNLTHISQIKAWARVTLADTGSVKTYPISHLSVQYGLNSIPRAVFVIPYGIDAELSDWFSGSSKELPSNLYSHLTDIYVKVNDDTSILMFRGYLSDMGHSRGVTGTRTGQLQTVCKAFGWLGMLAQQPISVLRGAGPMVFNGDPWWDNVVGLNWWVAARRIAYWDYSIPDELIITFQSLCNSQTAHGLGYQSGTLGSALAAEALTAYLSTPCANLHNWLDAYTRDVIAVSIGKVIHRNFGSFWDALVAFCHEFGFAVIPHVTTFRVAPLCRLGYDRPQYGAHHVKYSLDDISGYSINTQGLRPDPLRGVIMTDRYVGLWGQEEIDEAVGGYDASALYTETDGRFGRVMRLNAPSWFPSYGNGLIIAEQLCKQKAMNEAFGKVKMDIHIPYISGVSPGSLVEVRGTRKFPTLGARAVLGLALTTTMEISILQPKVETTVTLSHIMQEDVYRAAAFRSHPISNCYFLQSPLSGSLDYQVGW